MWSERHGQYFDNNDFAVNVTVFILAHFICPLNMNAVAEEHQPILIKKKSIIVD